MPPTIKSALRGLGPRGHAAAGLACLAALHLAAPAALAANTAAERAAKEGAQLLLKGKVAEACDRFAESQRLEPKPATQLALARCQQKAGRLAAALETYRALAASGTPSSSKMAAATALRTLEKKVPKLVVAIGASAPELRVARDGAPLDGADWNKPLPVDPGAHVVSATARGKKAWSTTVNVTSGTVTVDVPALEDDVAEIGAQTTQLAPLKSIAGASWSDGLGFVTPGGPAPTPQDRPTPPQVPIVRDQRLTRVGVDLDVGPVLFAARGSSTLGARGDFIVRPEWRRKSSWVAPWFDVPLTGGYVPDAGAGFVGAGARLGIDIHPARLPWIGFGPFAGYRFLVLVGHGDPVVDHCPDLGLMNLHFRTKEAENDEPLFDANVYVVERVHVAGEGGAATFGGLRLGLGGFVRFRAFVEYRFLPDANGNAYGILAQQLFGGIGLGFSE